MRAEQARRAKPKVCRSDRRWRLQGLADSGQLKHFAPTCPSTIIVGGLVRPPDDFCFVTKNAEQILLRIVNPVLKPAPRG